MAVKPCCKNPVNLIEHRERPDLVVKKCIVCGCRHFELTVSPGQIGLKGAPISG